jgi:2-polyprenyl-3-methyl-5-hydroxy-6-metoxy-1,4-benzoquinol methylase
MNEDLRCKICGSEKTRRLYGKDTFNIARCRSCGFIFNDKWNTLSDKARYIPEKCADTKAIKETFDREKEIFFDRFKDDLSQIHKLKSPGKILDIGCGPGYFLSLARSEGWDPFGIDINNSMAEFCKEHLSLNVIQGAMDRLHYPENYFDAVTLFHVLEHVPDIDQAVSNIEKILKPDGLLVIDVPNAMDIRRILFGKDWVQFGENHLWYFSAHTLGLLLRKHGLEIVKCIPHGGSQVLAMFNKTAKTGLRWSIDKYYRYLKPIRRPILFVLNHLGFSEDITIYARKIRC